MTEFDLTYLADKLLRDEYPDDMAKASCTCEPTAICGAHRLLKRYGELFDQLQKVNEERRVLRADNLRLAGEARLAAALMRQSMAVSGVQVSTTKRTNNEPKPVRA